MSYASSGLVALTGILYKHDVLLSVLQFFMGGPCFQFSGHLQFLTELYFGVFIATTYNSCFFFFYLTISYAIW